MGKAHRDVSKKKKNRGGGVGDESSSLYTRFWHTMLSLVSSPNNKLSWAACDAIRSSLPQNEARCTLPSWQSRFDLSYISRKLKRKRKYRHKQQNSKEKRDLRFPDISDGQDVLLQGTTLRFFIKPPEEGWLSVRNNEKPQTVAFLFAVLLFMSIFLSWIKQQDLAVVIWYKKFQRGRDFGSFLFPTYLGRSKETLFAG